MTSPRSDYWPPLPNQKKGSLGWFDGTGWRTFPPGTANQILAIANKVPAWVTGSVPLLFYGARVHKSVLQSVPSGAFTKINFDTPDKNPNFSFDTAVNFQYTAPISGYYDMTASVDATTNLDAVGTSYIIAFFKNGVELTRGSRTDVETVGISVSLGLVAAAVSEFLLVGDTIDVRVFQNSGANRNFGNVPTAAVCGIHLVGS